MTGNFDYPDLDKKLEAIKGWLKWASETNVVWIDQIDGGRVRESDLVWCELRPRRITAIGVDEIRYEDIDTPQGDAEFPRQDVMVGRRQIAFELRMKSRNQKHRQSAWYAATRAQLRLRTPYGKDRWLKPFDCALATVGEVVNMPEITIFDDRIEDVANLEFTLNTFLKDTDTAAIGTWIETVEVTSQLRDVSGTLLNSSLQLDQESMP